MGTVSFVKQGVIDAKNDFTSGNAKSYDKFRRDFGRNWANGTGVDQVNKIWHDRRTLAAAAEDLDLTALIDVFGLTVTFTKIKFIGIYNRNTGVGEVLLVGGDSASVPIFSATNDKLIIGPGGSLELANPCAAGYAVTNTTGDVLQLDAGSATIEYDIIVAGVG